MAGVGVVLALLSALQTLFSLLVCLGMRAFGLPYYILLYPAWLLSLRDLLFSEGNRGRVELEERLGKRKLGEVEVRKL